jgi:hypothetical protein
VRYEPVLIIDNAIRFEVINFFDDPARIKQDADSIINLIKEQTGPTAGDK